MVPLFEPAWIETVTSFMLGNSGADGMKHGAVLFKMTHNSNYTVYDLGRERYIASVVFERQ